MSEQDTTRRGVATPGVALQSGAQQSKALSCGSDVTGVIPSTAEPVWIATLRTACRQSTQSDVARRIGYSITVVSQTLSGTYSGDLNRIQAAVEGALMNVEVECPVAGLIPRQRCIEHQRRPFTPTNPAAVQLYRACRSGCPHSLLPPDPRFTRKPDPSISVSVPLRDHRAANAQPAVATNTGSGRAVIPSVPPAA